MATSNEAIALLRSIDSGIKQLLKQQGSNGTAAVMVAEDRDLDGQYGNPTVKFNPRDWNGESCKGRAMSDCPAEFLDMLAETFEYFARKADADGEETSSGKPVGPYKRKDAARARGWAQRVRNGYVSTATGEMVDPPALDGDLGGGYAGDPWAAAGGGDLSELSDSDIPF